MTNATERLYNLSPHDWSRIAALFPTSFFREREVDGAMELFVSAKRYAQEYAIEREHPRRIQTEVAATMAMSGVIAYRRYLEELEAQDRLAQHFGAVFSETE